MRNKLIEITKGAVVKNVMSNLSRYVVDHKGTILTGITISSNAAAIYVTYQNAPKIRNAYAYYMGELKAASDPEEKKKLYLAGFKEMAPLALPIIAFFGLSSGAAIANQKQNEAKIAALTTTLSMTQSMAQSAIAEYKSFESQVQKEVGEEKFKELKQEATQNHIEKIPDEEISRINVNYGEVLCYLPDFAVYFSNTRDGINLAMKNVNSVLQMNGMDGSGFGQRNSRGNEIVTYTDLFRELRIPTDYCPELGDRFGWEAGKIKHIDYSIGDGHTSSGIPYLSLMIFTDCDEV